MAIHPVRTLKFLTKEKNIDVEGKRLLERTVPYATTFKFPFVEIGAI
jgi:hypothetical protein